MRWAAVLCLVLFGCAGEGPPPRTTTSAGDCIEAGLFPGTPEFAACLNGPPAARNLVNEQGLHELGGMSHSGQK